MKLTIPAAALLAAVTAASRALPGRPIVPVLAGLRLHATDGQLTVSAFDYELSLQTVTTAADIGEPGTVLVSGRLLTDISKALPRQDVTLHTDGTRLVVNCGAARFTLQTLPLEEYPALPVTPDASGTIDVQALRTLVQQVSIACATDDTLPVLTGIRVEISGGTLTMAGTDRYRFAVASAEFAPATTTTAATALIPARALREIVKTLPDTGSVTLAIATDAGMVGVTADTAVATTRCLDGDLPKYKSLWPDEFTHTMTVDTKALSDAVNRVALVLDKAAPVRLEIQASTLFVSGGSSDDAVAREHLDCHLDGLDTTPMTIAFNPQYLLDGLSSLDAAVTHFGLNGPSKLALLRPADQVDPDESTPARDGDTPQVTGGYMLMPVRLSG